METTTKKRTKQRERHNLWSHSPQKESVFNSLLARLKKKSDLHTHIGTSELQAQQNHLCLVEYRQGITDYPGAGNSKKNVIGR